MAIVVCSCTVFLIKGSLNDTAQSNYTFLKSKSQQTLSYFNIMYKAGCVN